MRDTWLVLTALFLLESLVASSPAVAAPADSLPKAYRDVLPNDAAMKTARAEIQRCWSQKASDPLAMAKCSGYLVSQEDLAACNEKDLDIPCLAAKLCQAGEGNSECVPRPPTFDDPTYIAKWGRMLRYEEPTQAQATEALIPPSADRDKLAKCKRHAGSATALKNCLAESLLTNEDSQAVDCVRQHANDVLAVATQCLGEGIVVTLSKRDETAVRCVFGKPAGTDVTQCLEGAPPGSRVAMVVDCGKSARDPMELGACLKSIHLSARVRQDATCFSSGDPSQILACAKRHVKAPNGLNRLQSAMAGVDCLSKTEKPSPQDHLRCAGETSFLSEEKTKNTISCALQAAKPFDDALFKCVDGKAIPTEVKRVTKCYADEANRKNAISMVDCVADGAIPKQGLLREAVKCATSPGLLNVKDHEELLKTCQPQGTAKDVAAFGVRAKTCYAAYNKEKGEQDEADATHRLASCLAGGPQAIPPAVRCIMQNNTGSALEWMGDCAGELKVNLGGEADRLLKCYKQHKGDTLLVGYCLSGKKLNDDQTHALKCLRDEDNNAGRAACVAGKYVDKRVAKLASCAASSGGNYASAAMCATGAQLPFMKGLNPEWRTAVECATTSGGVPACAAMCTGTRLAIAELSKCLSGGFGKPGGCFGPNNTIVRFLREYYRPLEKVLKAIGNQKAVKNILADVSRGGLGKNNEIRKALRKADHEMRVAGRNVDREFRTGVHNIDRERRRIEKQVVNAILRPKIKIKNPF